MNIAVALWVWILWANIKWTFIGCRHQNFGRSENEQNRSEIKIRNKLRFFRQRWKWFYRHTKQWLCIWGESSLLLCVSRHRCLTALWCRSSVCCRCTPRKCSTYRRRSLLSETRPECFSTTCLAEISRFDARWIDHTSDSSTGPSGCTVTKFSRLGSVGWGSLPKICNKFVFECSF